MQFVYNPYTANYDAITPTLLGVTDPTDPSVTIDGQFFINTTTNELKIYYAGQWQTLHTLINDQALLLETGDYLLLETGDYLLLES